MALQPASPFPSILSNRHMSGIIKLCAPSSLICLLELHVWLLVVHSFINLSVKIKTIHPVPKASCHFDCLQIIIKIDPNIQYKGKLPSLIGPFCLWLLALLYLVETTFKSFFLVSFLSVFHPLPPLYRFPLLLYGRTDGRCVSKCRVSYYMPPIEAWRQWAVHLRPHS